MEGAWKLIFVFNFQYWREILKMDKHHTDQLKNSSYLPPVQLIGSLEFIKSFKLNSHS